MSIKIETVWMCVCDKPGCTNTASGEEFLKNDQWKVDKYSNRCLCPTCFLTNFESKPVPALEPAADGRVYRYVQPDEPLHAAPSEMVRRVEEVINNVCFDKSGWTHVAAAAIEEVAKAMEERGFGEAAVKIRWEMKR